MEQDTKDLPLIAYRIPGYSAYPAVIPAPVERAWIDDGSKGWANRCLPLRIANQGGWIVINNVDIEVVWNGHTSLNALRISPVEDSAEVAASMFGYGILNFMIPYLFHTPLGFDLMARAARRTFPVMAPAPSKDLPRPIGSPTSSL